MTWSCVLYFGRFYEQCYLEPNPTIIYLTFLLKRRFDPDGVYLELLNVYSGLLHNRPYLCTGINNCTRQGLRLYVFSCIICVRSHKVLHGGIRTS